ncbi:MAG: hypothetical protein ABR548_10065 [Actinomycetota bacterium]|nr:hypothetical protein [Actinomycetota bacterium]
MNERYRCAGCGNLTRFDVVENKRTRSFYHFTLGGDVAVEEEETLAHTVERVVCRWCGSEDQIETLTSVGPEE